MNILIIGENNPISLERIYKKNFKLLKNKRVNICSFWKPKNFLIKKFINFQEKYFYFIFSFIQNFLLKKKLSNNFSFYDLVIVFNGYHMKKNFTQNYKYSNR